MLLVMEYAGGGDLLQFVKSKAKLDEKVARLHLKRIGVELDTLTDAQSDYLSIPKEGPYKPEHYRY